MLVYQDPLDVPCVYLISFQFSNLSYTFGHVISLRKVSDLFCATCCNFPKFSFDVIGSHPNCLECWLRLYYMFKWRIEYVHSLSKITLHVSSTSWLANLFFIAWRLKLSLESGKVE
ncbi:hypothetical protein Ahy_A09g045467 isoform B [Arachis hypogaea]|uniref:Uncharacterized protein n=1 Tax=Arachis hypogaea TaxID=3818 RepID=A0A445BMC3_ARAHY|nr:hypothetical protein Ahy_A09g045467 isoform B [Arachis hypogaea]